MVMLLGRIAPMNDNAPTGNPWRRGLGRTVGLLRLGASRRGCAGLTGRFSGKLVTGHFLLTPQAPKDSVPLHEKSRKNGAWVTTREIWSAGTENLATGWISGEAYLQ
jgi:hypothetical protein